MDGWMVGWMIGIDTYAEEDRLAVFSRAVAAWSGRLVAVLWRIVVFRIRLFAFARASEMSDQVVLEHSERHVGQA